MRLYTGNRRDANEHRAFFVFGPTESGLCGKSILNTFASIKNNSTMDERDFQAMQSVVWAKGELRLGDFDPQPKKP